MVKFFRFSTEHTVNFILQPWQFFFMILASWVHHEQQKINEFYQAELEAVMKAQGKTSIKAHWEVLAAIDFTTVEIWTKGGLVTYYYRRAA